MIDRYYGEPLDHQQGWLFHSCISKLQLHSLRQRSPQDPMPLPPKSNLFKSDYLDFFPLEILRQAQPPGQGTSSRENSDGSANSRSKRRRKRGKALFVTGGIIKGPFKRMFTISYGRYTCIM